MSRIIIFNDEPDGRMRITDENYRNILVFGTYAVDRLTELIVLHCSNSGDGKEFWLDTTTGESGLMYPTPQP